MPNLILDHIVLIVPDLKRAIQYFAETFDVTPIIGGRHLGFGTHNALLGLGEPAKLIYLELLARDPEDKNHYDLPWLNISSDQPKMYVGSWCARCDSTTDINEVNQMMNTFGVEYNHGNVRKMQRKTPANDILSWQIASTAQQIIISKGFIPFLIKWDDMTLHPATNLLPENFLSFHLDFSAPNCKTIKSNLQKLGFVMPDNLSFTDAENTSINLSLYKEDKINTFSSC